MADVFTVPRGLVVTGRVQRGDIRTGDRLWLLGGGEPVAVTVRGMERGCVLSGDRDHAPAETNVGLLIAGVDADGVRPGMWLSDARAHTD